MGRNVRRTLRALTAERTGAVLGGLGLIVASWTGYSILSSNEFWAQYMVKSVDSVYDGTPLPEQDVEQARQEAQNFTKHAYWFGYGLAAMMGGVLLGGTRFRRIVHPEETRPFTSYSRYKGSDRKTYRL